jgi:hypothetical protein
MRNALIILLLTSCAKGGETTSSGQETQPSRQIGANLPSDSNSLDFIDGFVSLDIQDFRPGSSSGAILTYANLTFRPDESWHANGSIRIGEDQMECSESGSWSMTPAESSTVATVTWTVDTGSCSRSAGVEVRAQISLLDDGEYRVQFR